MSQPNLIKIGVTGDFLELSAIGRKFIQRWEDGLNREDRAADGTLRRDVIARKRSFTLSYETIDESTIDRFEELFQYNEPLTIEITHLLVTKSYQVLPGIFERERLLAVWGGLWTGFSIELREV